MTDHFNNVYWTKNVDLSNKYLLRTKVFLIHELFTVELQRKKSITEKELCI